MRVLTSILVLALAGGCDLFGGDDAPPPPVADPALDPAPVTPQADPAPQANGNPGGSFTIPGLEGFPIPLPSPNPNHTDPVPPARGSLPAVPPGSHDANGHMTRAFLEAEAGAVHQALVRALDEHERTQIVDVPFEIVAEQNEPNAAAGCTNGDRRPVMMITSAMLELAAGISEAKAYDELANTTTYETYVTAVVEQVQNERPIQGVDPSLHRAPHSIDAHKLARQRHLFDQQIAFIVGHELAHHYRGHTNCVAGRSDAEIQRDQLSQLLAHTVPPFSQPREVEADMWGIVDVLEAGQNRPGGSWTEEGALLNLDFFSRLSNRGGAELLMIFLSTHPPSAVRIPIVRSTSQQWTPGYRPPRMPVPGESGNGLPGNFPFPQGLPIDPSRLPFPLPLPGAGR